MTETLVPNHHGDHPGFAGPTGYLAAFSFSIGRHEVAQFAADLVDLKPGDFVVDIGCGPGNAARIAAQRGATVVGVDPAAVMLRVARRLSRHTQNVSFVLGAAEAIPVDDAAACAAWSLAAVHHGPDLDAGLREVHRVLQPGGLLVAIDALTQPGATGHASHGWTEDQAERFAALCRDHGFSAVGIERRTADKRPRVAVRASRD
jgi:ubiquinone/menaquinone biosynthesis C-methylase UbiE